MAVRPSLLLILAGGSAALLTVERDYSHSDEDDGAQSQSQHIANSLAVYVVKCIVLKTLKK